MSDVLMGGNYCAFNYGTMPSRDVCVISAEACHGGGPSLTDERPNLLISPTGVEVGWGEGRGVVCVCVVVYMTSQTPRLAAR